MNRCIREVCFRTGGVLDMTVTLLVTKEDYCRRWRESTLRYWEQRCGYWYNRIRVKQRGTSIR